METGAKGSEEGQAGTPSVPLNNTTPSVPLNNTTPSVPLNNTTPSVPLNDTTRRTRLTAAAPHLIVTAVSLWLTRSFWLPGSYVVGFDTYAYSGPNLEVNTQAWRQWHLPVLNDLIFGGVPHLGNPQAGALYPPQLLALAMSTNRAMGVIVSAHMVLLGIGMLVLARRLGLSTIGAVTAAIVALAAGATLTKTVQYEQILVLAWVPTLLVAIHATIHSSRPWRAAAALGATTAAILLAGHPQLVYEAAILAIAATLGFIIGDGRWRRVGHVAIGGAIGVAIAIPQLLAVLYATADSAITGGRDLESLRSSTLSLPRKYLAQSVLGTVQDRDPAVFASGFESITFIGVVVALLAVVGAVALVTARRSRSWALALGLVGLLSLIWATGPRSPLFTVAFEFLPGFDLARASSRWLVIVALVSAVFAGAGVDVLRRGAQRIHITFAVGATGVVTLLLVVGVLATADTSSAVIWALTAGVVLALLAANTFVTRSTNAAAIAILVLAAVELGTMSLHSIPQKIATDQPFTSHRTATTDFLADADAGFTVALTDEGRPVEYQVPGLRPNANVLNGIASIDGYDGGVQITQRWADALRRFQADPVVDLPLRNSLAVPVDPDALARLAVRYVVLDRARPAADLLPGWVGPVAVDESFEVWENPSWLGDAVAWPTAIAADDPAVLLRTTPQAAASAAIVGNADEAFTCNRAPTACEPFGITVERSRPEQIDLTVDVEQRTLVSVAQQALGGWRVDVDGRRADVVEVDGIFLGVDVPAGSHHIRFTYSSPWLLASLVISLLAIAATIALIAADRFPKRRRVVQDAGGDDR